MGKELMMDTHATTILAVRKDGRVAIAGDGQVTLGQNMIMKHGAQKVRRLYDGKVLAGFAGATADAFTLFELFEAKLKELRGNMVRAAVEMTKEWRKDKYLRKLEAMLLLADSEHILVLSGTGDVARALARHSDMDAEAIAREAMRIASEICVYTNGNLTVETL